MPPLEHAINYLSYLGVSLVLLSAFYVLYTVITPIRELTLIRRGNIAAALSLSGALIGFSLTLAAAFASHAALPTAALWSLAAMVVQLLAYGLTTRLVGNASAAIEQDNLAVGLLVGAVSLSVGLLNAACLL